MEDSGRASLLPVHRQGLRIDANGDHRQSLPRRAQVLKKVPVDRGDNQGTVGAAHDVRLVAGQTACLQAGERTQPPGQRLGGASCKAGHHVMTVDDAPGVRAEAAHREPW